MNVDFDIAKQAIAELTEVRAERDRLREALRDISSMWGCDIMCARERAKEALNPR